MKTTTTWAVLGSVVINLALAFAVAAVFSVTPRAQATVVQATAAPAAREAMCSHAPREVRPAAHEQGDSYLVAVRMGWGAG